MAPQAFSLGQNYPNPFNPSTVIPFTLSKPGMVTLSIFNSAGQLVKTLVNARREKGNHTVVWKGEVATGNIAGAGLYLYQLKMDGKDITRKMLLLDGGYGKTRLPVKTMRPVPKGDAFIKPSDTFTVIITGEAIDTYQCKGLTLNEGSVFSFSVNRLTPSLIFVSIYGGTFQMGDVENAGNSDEKPVHNVTVSDFEMSAHEITNAHYAKYLNEALGVGEVELIKSTDTFDYTEFLYQENVYGKTGPWSGKLYLRMYSVGVAPDPEADKCSIFWDYDAFSVDGGKTNWPVVNVTWEGAKAFALHYRLDLPTEAEWEYACRGGKQCKYGTVDGAIDKTKAYYDSINVRYLKDVGSYPANPFGLFDMSGNVWEWCHDWYGSYSSENQINPAGPPSGSHHVRRGGSRRNSANYCRSANRTFSSGGEGFRVVRRANGQHY
jgi:formylglycine-generating enzyme required for sulfatase activity